MKSCIYFRFLSDFVNNIITSKMLTGAIIICLTFALNSEKHQEDGVWMDINPENDIHLVYFNNYTTVLNFKQKWIAFVYNDALSTEEDSDFSNYSKVAKNLRGKNFFTRLDGKVVSYVVEDFLETTPGIIFYYQKAAYLYKGSFEYEDILDACEKFSDPEWQPEPSEVIFVNSSNYEEIVPNTELGLIIAYGFDDEKQNWLYLGRLKTVAEKLKPQGIPVFAVNNKTDHELVEKLKLSQLGHIKFVRYGKMYIFKQEKQDHVSSIIKHTLKSKKFPSHLVKSYKVGQFMLKSFPDEDIGMFLGVFEKENNSWFKLFKEIVYSYNDDFKFFHTFDKETGEKFGCKQRDCLITLFPERVKSPFDEERQASLALSPEKLLDFDTVSQHLYRAARPMVGHMSNNIKVMNVYRGTNPRAVLYMDVDFNGFAFKENQYRIKPLWELAKQYPSITFAFANREDHESTMKSRNIDDSGNEADFVIEHDDKYYYLLEEEFNSNKAKKFLKSYIEGTIRPVLRSEPIPAKPYDANGIRILVGKNFDNVILKEPKNFLILITSEYGEESKKIDKIFVEVQKKYKEISDLEFVRFNSDNNLPPPEYDSAHQPAIFFTDKNNKKNPVMFQKQNEATIEHLSAFIEDNFLSKVQKNKGKSEL